MPIGAVSSMAAGPPLRAAGAGSHQAPVAPAESPGTSAKLYMSPIINLDESAGLYLLQYRDSQTGEVRVQVPPERVVREYQEKILAKDTRMVDAAPADDSAPAPETAPPAAQAREESPEPTAPGARVSIDA